MWLFYWDAPNDFILSLSCDALMIPSLCFSCTVVSWPCYIVAGQFRLFYSVLPYRSRWMYCYFSLHLELFCGKHWVHIKQWVNWDCLRQFKDYWHTPFYQRIQRVILRKRSNLTEYLIILGRLIGEWWVKIRLLQIGSQNNYCVVMHWHYLCLCFVFGVNRKVIITVFNIYRLLLTFLFILFFLGKEV